MTREEAKTWLNKLYARADITDEYGDMEDMQPYEEAVYMAINSLSVIEDIKAEIKELPYQRIFGHVSSYSLLDTVLEIIDKHCEGDKE